MNWVIMKPWFWKKNVYAIIMPPFQFQMECWMLQNHRKMITTLGFLYRFFISIGSPLQVHLILVWFHWCFHENLMLLLMCSETMLNNNIKKNYVFISYFSYSSIPFVKICSTNLIALFWLVSGGVKLNYLK